MSGTAEFSALRRVMDGDLFRRSSPLSLKAIHELRRDLDSRTNTVHDGAMQGGLHQELSLVTAETLRQRHPRRPAVHPAG